MRTKHARVGSVLRLAFVAMTCLLLVALAAPATTFGAITKTKLTIAHIWPESHSHTRGGLGSAIKGFQERYPDISVEVVPAYTTDKYIAEIAAGTPKDIIFVDGSWVSSWALRGLIQPLDGFIAKSGVSPKDFVPPAWRQCTWGGKVWAMPIQVDPNFALVWNKELFEEGGLPSEVGPRTLDDFEAVFAKLTRFDSTGLLKRIGMVPWDIYGYANAMYTWGWIFGGEFFDYEKNKATAHTAANVEALEYLRDSYLRYSAKLAALNQGLPLAAAQFRLAAGREAMTFLVSGDLAELVRHFPSLELGIGRMFSKTGENPAWAGGWTIAIPAGAKNAEAAWKLVHYLTADPEGTALFAKGSGWLPAYLPSPVFKDVFAKDPYMRVYMQILFELKYQRPAIPVQETYANELDAALSRVFAGEVQPADALQYVSERVDAELKKALERAATRKK